VDPIHEDHDVRWLGWKGRITCKTIFLSL